MSFKHRSKRPAIKSVSINDGFWSPYIDQIRKITVPHVFAKMEESGYVQNLVLAAQKQTEGHRGNPFSDGLLFESMRGACDFLASDYDPELDLMLDRLVALTKEASDAIDGGYLNTCIAILHPECRWASES